METKLSTKGQVVLPGRIRRKLGLEAGDSLDAKLEGGRLVLVPRRKPSRKARIIIDAVTGLPVLTAGPGACRLTSKQVREALDEVPRNTCST
jgi:AbrB family looped-hinge helix DNA binding protein